MSAYVDLTAQYTYKKLTVWTDFDSLANNDQHIKENNWEDSTVAIFYQAAAPTGWTKITTANDKALRVVSGAGGGTGGVAAMSATITLAHTAHSISSQAAHVHSLPHQHEIDYDIIANGSAAGLRTLVGNGNNVIRSWTAGGTAKNVLIPISDLVDPGCSSSDAHDHGGNTTAAALSDITLAYVDAIFCSKDTSSGYTDLTLGFTHNARHVYDYLTQLAVNDAYNYARMTPAGTVSLFGNVTAPVGWTKLTTQNDKAVRVVSGTGGGAGGSKALSSTITLAHAHTVTAAAAHSHTVPVHSHQFTEMSFGTGVAAGFLSPDGSNYMRDLNNTAVSATVVKGIASFNGGHTIGPDGAHSHTVASALTDTVLAYSDVIQASKDAAGAPAAYTNYSTFFADQALLAYQDLQVMANNDAYLKFHTMPSASVMFFYQAAAPLNWTKLVTHNDCAIRIVSGATGGSPGGTTLMSAGLTLAHTHTLSTESHSHVVPAHTHALATTTDANAGVAFAPPRYAMDPPGYFSGYAGFTSDRTGAGSARLWKAQFSPMFSGLATDVFAHSHGGATGSALSNVTLAYADVIRCSKN